MKEYVYIAHALENLLCDELTGVICSENYTGRSLGHGYRRIFDRFFEFRKDYMSLKNCGLEETTYFNKQLKQWEEERKQMVSKFARDLSSLDPETDYEGLANAYLQDYLKENVPTVSMRLGVFPYLVKKFKETIYK